MAVMLAALSALAFGTGDFFGGLSARRMAPALATITAQLVGLVVIIGVCLFASGEPLGRDLAIGALAGVAGALGLTLFYWAMSIGPMSVVAPVSALLNAFVPVMAGFIQGQRPAPLALVGIILAVPAILLISREPTPVEIAQTTAKVSAETSYEPRRWLSKVGGLPVIAAGVAGIGFGFFFVFLSQTSAQSGLWPIVSARGSAVVVVSISAVLTKMTGPTATGLRLAALAGLLDVTGNTFYLLATREGLIILVGVVAAMYPASTVLLARFGLKERLAAHQVLGLLAAALAVALIAGGG